MRRRTDRRLSTRAGRCGAASRNDEFANSLDRLQEGMNEELENSLRRSSAGSASQVKTWVSLKVGCLERMTPILVNRRLRANPLT